MELLNDASTREQLLIKKAKQQQIPITGSIELLPLCNMNCDMCYVRMSREEMEQVGVLGVFTGGLKASAGGISAALIFGYLASLFFHPQMKK